MTYFVPMFNYTQPCCTFRGDGHLPQTWIQRSSRPFTRWSSFFQTL